MIKRLLLSLYFLLLALNAEASHIVGSDIYYDNLGNNQYRITITLFRDCFSTGAAFDPEMSVGIYRSNGSMYEHVLIPFPGSVPVPIVFDNPCVTAPSNLCVERATYITIVTLPPIPGGYTVSYQRCCYGSSVTNLQDAEGTGLTLETHINTSVNTSSPRFVNYPPLVICNNEDLNMSHHATDPDGDVLVYDLVTPFNGGTAPDPAPVPSGGPPFTPVLWEAGFDELIPLGPGSNTTINPNTGHLFADANQLGKYVVGIRVREYRNGVEIGSTTRAFIFNVINCNIQLQAGIGTQESSPIFVSYCQGLNWTFDNLSFGGDFYSWDFGVPGVTTDVSSQFEPTFTYPEPGIYQAMLVVNPGWPCTDTAYVTLNLNNILEVDFTYSDSMCFEGHSVDFQGQVVIGNPQAALSWEFTDEASIQTANGATVNGVQFTNGGSHDVWLKGTYGICNDSTMHSIFIYPDPVPAPDLPVGYKCNGFTHTFQNNSTDATIFSWDFGVPGIDTDVSSAFSPTYTFPGPGTYTVTLTASIPEGCSRTIQQDYTFYEQLSASFTHNDSMCITDNSYNFDATVTGPPITTYLWNFGPNANPSTSTLLDVNNVVYNTYGNFPVTFTASFMECSRTVNSSVKVFRQPEIGFGLVQGIQCDPFPAQFRDSSISDTPIQYFWTFGDGGTSTLKNPGHTYFEPGQFPVTLQIITTEGCKDTLTLTRLDLINVKPTPIAGFLVDPPTTDICNSAITFTDISEGGDFYVYLFDDEIKSASTAQNPVYSYFSPGTHNPMQIVSNEFGCSDTARSVVMIDPFTVYIPNAFTPDGDEYNNTFGAAVALETVEWNFRIYNRWGEMVFESADQDSEWDGTYNGTICQDGVYSYILRYISCADFDRWEEITGHVVLLR